MWLIYGQLLLSTEDSVARIAQTGNDVSVFIQSLVHRAGVDAHVRIRVENRLDALGCGDKNQEANILDALAAQILNSGSGGATRQVRWSISAGTLQ